MSITCSRIQKTFSLGVEDRVKDKWVFHNEKWRKMKPRYLEEVWYAHYWYGLATTSDMLQSWLNYLPGVVEWHNDGDFCVTFDMNKVEKADWAERHLIDMLGDMVSCVKMRCVIHADRPCPTYSFDVYGYRVDYCLYPAIDPLGGMLDIEYPHNMDPTGRGHYDRFPDGSQ